MANFVHIKVAKIALLKHNKSNCPVLDLNYTSLVISKELVKKTVNLKLLNHFL